MSQVALFSYTTGSTFQCAVEYNGLLYVGTGTSIVKLNPFNGTVIDTKSYAVGVRGSSGFLSAGKSGTTGFFVTSLGTLVSVDLTQSLIVDTVVPGVADVDSNRKYIAIDGGTVYVASYVPGTDVLSVWRRFPTDSGAPLASLVITPDTIRYADGTPLAVASGKIYLPGGLGASLIGFVYTFTIATNTITQRSRPALSRYALTSTLVGSTLFIGGAALVKDVYTWDTGADVETGSGSVEVGTGNGMGVSTTDGVQIYAINYPGALPSSSKLWTLTPSLNVVSSVAVNSTLASATPVAMMYSGGYIYIPYSSQAVLVWYIPPPPTPTPSPVVVTPLQQTSIPQTYENVHLPSGNDIVPYSRGAVVPPAIPPIPARTIENIKLPNGPKDYRYCRRPVLPYRNVPEPASYPNNPGQRRVCLVEGERPVAESGSPLQTYIPGQGVVQVATNRPQKSRVAATWPPKV